MGLVQGQGWRRTQTLSAEAAGGVPTMGAGAFLGEAVATVLPAVLPASAGCAMSAGPATKETEFLKVATAAAPAAPAAPAFASVTAILTAGKACRALDNAALPFISASSRASFVSSSTRCGPERATCCRGRTAGVMGKVKYDVYQAWKNWF